MSDFIHAEGVQVLFFSRGEVPMCYALPHLLLAKGLRNEVLVGQFWQANLGHFSRVPKL